MKNKFKFELGSKYDKNWRDGTIFYAELIDGSYVVTWEDEGISIEDRKTIYEPSDVKMSINEGYWKVLD